MNIRTKIILIVLPLLISALLTTGIVSSLSARNGLTRVAVKSLGFKTEELKKYMENQWQLLVTNDFSEKPEYVNAAQNAVKSYAETLIRSESELIIAVNYNANLVMSTGNVLLEKNEQSNMQSLIDKRKFGWINLRIEENERVGHAFFFPPFNWYVLVTEDKQIFYREIKEIMIQNGIILMVSSVILLSLLLVFSIYLARPLERVVKAMRDITTQNDFSKQVEVEYPDEIGRVAHQFNIMTKDLDKAYSQVKDFAIKEVIARRKVAQREYETLNLTAHLLPILSWGDISINFRSIVFLKNPYY